jgi:tripartite-type tricarboxylate transporter receptor subunit TctC
MGAVNGVLGMIVILFAVSGFAAQDFPTKPINLYVGFPPGGVAGNSANSIAPGAQDFLKQPVVVQYKPGAGRDNY